MTEQIETAKANRYSLLVEHIFMGRYEEGATTVPFARDDIETAASTLGIKLPKNLGDVIYSFRFRTELPKNVKDKAPQGRHWIIRLAGKGNYAFSAVTFSRVVPTVGMAVVKVPDATPQIVAKHTLGDEQALLAKVRYNRLVDVFLSLTAYSLQNHLRTSVPALGQVEVDEIYVGVDYHGTQYVVPVQAKGGSDQIGVVQAEQDLAICAEKFSGLVPRAVAAQFMADDVIAMFELALREEGIVLVAQQHYKLVPASEITDAERADYAKASGRLPPA